MHFLLTVGGSIIFKKKGEGVERGVTEDGLGCLRESVRQSLFGRNLCTEVREVGRALWVSGDRSVPGGELSLLKAERPYLGSIQGPV